MSKDGSERARTKVVVTGDATQVDLICLVTAEILDDIGVSEPEIGRCDEAEGIGAIATDEPIGISAADQDVGVDAAVQSVAADTTGERVVAAATVEQIQTLITKKLVGA